mmetsp:Transcript_68605/g.135888  ORF Transcript_68605/g.135888 Transcript_68605/m.135888 type:complete len:227 (+) Transcript_68605:99-779(+)
MAVEYVLESQDNTSRGTTVERHASESPFTPPPVYTRFSLTLKPFSHLHGGLVSCVTVSLRLSIIRGLGHLGRRLDFITTCPPAPTELRGGMRDRWLHSTDAQRADAVPRASALSIHGAAAPHARAAKAPGREEPPAPRRGTGTGPTHRSWHGSVACSCPRCNKQSRHTQCAGRESRRRPPRCGGSRPRRCLGPGSLHSSRRAHRPTEPLPGGHEPLAGRSTTTRCP